MTGSHGDRPRLRLVRDDEVPPPDDLELGPADDEPKGAENRVFIHWVDPFHSYTWRELGSRPYAKFEVLNEDLEIPLPRAVTFVVGGDQHGYASMSEVAVQAAWRAATEPDRETQIVPVDAEGPAVPGLGTVRTVVYGTHGAITRLRVTPQSCVPEAGRVWLHTPERSAADGPVGVRIDDLLAPRGDLAPQRWLCLHPPGTAGWWEVIARSLTTPGQDVAFVDPSDPTWPEQARKVGATAASATVDVWEQALRLTDASTRVPLGLVEITSVDGVSPDTLVPWLRHVFPDAEMV